MSFQFLEQDKPIYSKGQKDKKTPMTVIYSS